MEVHYSKHHRTYYDDLCGCFCELEPTVSGFEIFANISQHSPAVRNNGGELLQSHLVLELHVSRWRW